MIKKYIFIAILMIATCILSIVTSIIGIVSISKLTENKETIVYVPVDMPSSKDDEKEPEKEPETPSSKDDEKEPEEDKPSQSEELELYTDEDGNTYELIRRYTSNDGRKLVLYMNVKTKQTSLAIESYFDEHFTKVSNNDSI